MVLFGHPTGNPNSHHAALAHFEANRLEAFCVPWIPSEATLRTLTSIPLLGRRLDRLSRRRFAPLSGARTIQSPFSECRRMLLRALGAPSESLSYAANDWLMKTMATECDRPSVRVVHSYEDCSLSQFEAARRLDKACLYDMPIGYYPWWERRLSELKRTYSNWIPSEGLPASQYVRPAQKIREMELADLVLTPSTFVEQTIREYFPQKRVARASYGVDHRFWHPLNAPACEATGSTGKLRFIYAGQCSIRKGTPLLLDAWRAAGLTDATLELVGTWQLAADRRRDLPDSVQVRGPVSSTELLQRFQSSDVFLFPSFFEGFGLVLLEAMACGLPAVATESTAGPDVLTERCGRLTPAGDLDALVECLRWFDRNRSLLPSMGQAARRVAETFTWDRYRHQVSSATETLFHA